MVAGRYYFGAEFIYSFWSGDRTVQGEGVPALALVAVRIGRTRLIDNMFIETT